MIVFDGCQFLFCFFLQCGFFFSLVLRLCALCFGRLLVLLVCSSVGCLFPGRLWFRVACCCCDFEIWFFFFCVYGFFWRFVVFFVLLFFFFVCFLLGFLVLFFTFLVFFFPLGYRFFLALLSSFVIRFPRPSFLFASFLGFSLLPLFCVLVVAVSVAVLVFSGLSFFLLSFHSSRFCVVVVVYCLCGSLCPFWS